MLIQKDVIDIYIDIHILKLMVLRHALTFWFLLREHNRSWGGRDGGEAAIPGGAVLYAAADWDVPLTVNQIYNIGEGQIMMHNYLPLQNSQLITKLH